jgi:hypothetical protein
MTLQHGDEKLRCTKAEVCVRCWPGEGAAVTARNPAWMVRQICWSSARTNSPHKPKLDSIKPTSSATASSTVQQAEYKPRQLAHAEAAGLTVPPTLITNDPHAVADFAARQPHGIVTKTLYARMPRTEDGRLTGVVYTNDVPPDRYRDPTIAATAHLFQAKLVKKADLRVTVVGGCVFATYIDNPGELDWRRSHDNITYQPYELPDAVVIGVHRPMRSLGLVFGALDFVLTDQGHQFIEINPNGQWGWIEHHTRQPISRALATALTATAGDKHRRRPRPHHRSPKPVAPLRLRAHRDHHRRRPRLPDHAPYDRIIVTFAVTSIPPAWIDQTRAGGIILAPVFSGLVKLTVTGQGTAEGRFIGPGYFMRHRTTPNTSPSGRPVALTDEPRWPSRLTDLPSSTYYDNDFQFYLYLHVRDLAHGYRDGNLTINAPDGAHAHLTPEGQLTQSGPRRLWDDIEIIHRTWCSLDKPPRERFGLTVSAHHQAVWLDTPSSAHTWPIGASASL